MEKKTKGAWLIHHGRKVQATTSQDFDAIAFASKCGVMLSAISGEAQYQINSKRLDALARANQISPRTEVPAILTELERQRLILRGANGIEVLGLTGQAVLEHTSTIFDESPHENYEDGVLDVSEMASESPITSRFACDFLSDTFRLSTSDATNTLHLGKNIGFFDAEALPSGEQLLFNGNLFRKDEANKVNAVISSIKPEEGRCLSELNARLQATGCLPLNVVNNILGRELFGRLHSIGMFDVNIVGNESGKSYFVTRPAAFSKFSNSIADDALDLAKALVASLTYGMTVSSYYRGRIQMISALMTKLINGGTVGPATAIGNDYQALECRGVVRVTPTYNGRFNMSLLKPEVGRLALAVIQDGDVTAETIAQLPGAKVTEYINPEATREVRRKNSTEAVKLSARNLLDEIRMGGLSR